MTTCEIWDVVKVAFPYTDRPIQQRRPALVVAHHTEPGSPALLWVLMITSASHRRWTGDVEISRVADAGLSVASIVRTAKVTTVEQSGVEPIGFLPAVERAAVSRHVSGLLRRVLAAGR